MQKQNAWIVSTETIHAFVQLWNLGSENLKTVLSNLFKDPLKQARYGIYKQLIHGLGYKLFAKIPDCK